MLQVKTRVLPSEVHGVGLFAAEFIPAGTVIHRYIDGFDKSFTTVEFAALPANVQDYIRHYGYISKVNGNWIINFDDIRFTNHSKEPNMAPDINGSDFEPPVIALRDIKEGEELLEDYASFEADSRFGI